MPNLQDIVEVNKTNITIEKQTITLDTQLCCCHLHKRPITKYKIVELNSKTNNTYN